jgi:hypothetical protein
MPARPAGRVLTASVAVLWPIRLSAVESKAAARVPGVPHPWVRASVAVPEPGRAPDGLAHRELGRRPRRLVTFGSGQRRADQLAVDGALFLVFGALGFFLGFLATLDRFGGLLRLGGQGRTGRHLWFGRALARGLAVAWRPRRPWTRHPGKDLLIEGPRGFLLLPLRRQPGMAVVVLGLARRAAGLSDLLLDQRHHRVVRDPTLAGTVVVENVTKP